jgi:hypothetical protein
MCFFNFLHYNGYMKVSFSKRSIPLAILLLLLLTFAFFFPWLGYYRNDWLALAATQFSGSMEILQTLPGNSPLLTWLQTLPALFLDHQPVCWQLFALMTRYLAVLAFWYFLHILWPGHLREVTWMAFLFAVLPVFDLQNLAVIHGAFWLIYAVYFLSLAFMLLAFRTSQRYWVYTLLSLAAALVYTSSIPFFWGLELIRPVIIWFYFSSLPTKKMQLSRTTLMWLPYLVVSFVGILLQILGSGQSTFGSGFKSFTALINVGGLLQLFQFALRELINLLLGSWYRTIEPGTIILSDRFWLLSMLAGGVVGTLVVIYLSKLFSRDEINESGGERILFKYQALLFGVVALSMGLVPYWLTQENFLQGVVQGGYKITAIYGLSILVVAILEVVIANSLRRLLLVGVLIGLAVVFHFRIANDYRWSWTEQKRFFWQLAWRIPELHPGTAFFSDSLFFANNGGSSSLTAALSFLFPPQSNRPGSSNQFLLLDPAQAGESLAGQIQPGETIALTYEPENGNCLWVLQPGDVERPQVSKIVRQNLPYTDLDRISALSQNDTRIPGIIFGTEPDHTWCYYYQKAELARQVNDYDKIAELGDEVRSSGYEPNNVQEWLTFIDGYAHVARWSQARKLSELVYDKQPSFAEWLCSSWNNILSEQEPSSEQKPGIQEMLTKFQCSDRP